MPNDANYPCTPEEVVRIQDTATGLDGMIVVHSTRLGPAAGGCRFWRYSTPEEAGIDALRLAEGMAYKNALAGLPLGGGKAVLREPEGCYDRAALFRAFGDAVQALNGAYVTAEDVGTSIDDMICVSERTDHVAGLPPKPGAPGGDPSPWTALGVFRAMEVTVERRLGVGLADIRVGVQGLGHVGSALCKLLHEAGAQLVVAERRSDIAARVADRYGATVMSSAALLEARVDVFAPCALGAVLDEGSIQRLRAKVVCGAANNQLATPNDGLNLAARGVLYAPDYLVNAGGIINVAAEYLGWSNEEVRDRVNRIGARLTQVLDLGERNGMPPAAAADALARSIIAGDRGALALAA